MQASTCSSSSPVTTLRAVPAWSKAATPTVMAKWMRSKMCIRDRFQGAYAEIVRGVNAMLDAILLPIGEGNRILAQVSNGKICLLYTSRCV